MTLRENRVKIFSTYPASDASFRQRMIPLKEFLLKENFKVYTYSIFSDWMFINRNRSKLHRLLVSILLLFRLIQRFLQILLIQNSDNIVLHREIFPFFLPKLELFAMKKARHSSMDFDDAIWVDPSQGVDWRRRFRRPDRFSEVVKHANIVTVASPYLERWARRYSNNVVTLLTLPPIGAKKKRYGFPTQIIWIGSDSGEVHLRSKARVIAEVAARHGVTVNVLAGHRMLNASWPSNFKIELWSHARERELLAVDSIGVMPLVSDEWAKGKGAYKLLQYMANGIPFVASKIGINQEYLVNLGCGFVVDSDLDWANSLEKLLDDANIFESMGEKGYEWISTKVSANSFEVFVESFGVK